MSTFHFSRSSNNAKTGKMPVSTSSEDTCPPSCPWKEKGCYAKYGPLSWHWKKVNTGQRGMDWEAFMKAIHKLPEGTLWRHNQAGDLVGNDGKICRVHILDLITFNSGRCGYSYTHYNPRLKWNRQLIRRANDQGFTINLSADSIKEADEFMKLGCGPVTTLVNSTEERKSFQSPDGNRITICPAMTTEGMTCEKCRLCAKPDRKSIIAFPTHGSGKNHIDNVLSQEEK